MGNNNNFAKLSLINKKNFIGLQSSKEPKKMKNQVLNMMMCMCCSDNEEGFAIR